MSVAARYAGPQQADQARLLPTLLPVFNTVEMHVKFVRHLL
jgi:hypothetical protein